MPPRKRPPPSVLTLQFNARELERVRKAAALVHLSAEEFVLRAAVQEALHVLGKPTPLITPTYWDFADLVAYHNAHPPTADNLVSMDLEPDVHAKLEALAEKHQCSVDVIVTSLIDCMRGEDAVRNLWQRDAA